MYSSTHSYPFGMLPHPHLADTLSFIYTSDILFPVPLGPFLSWLSHLFENILQELLEKECAGGKCFENLHLKMSLFYPHI